jgi:phosphoribosyl-dephospho-CoA transferase
MTYTSAPEHISNKAWAFRAHDLIRVDQVTDLQWNGELPHWVQPYLRRAPFVVVRGAPTQKPDLVPVGIRGPRRGQRLAAFLPVNAIHEFVTPEQLANIETPEMRDLPVFHALRHIGTGLVESGYAWGPTGSVAFELVSGMNTATSESDLDLIIRAPVPLCHSTANNLFRYLSSFAVQVDAKLDTPAGVIALAEYVQRKLQVLVRATHGASMVHDPWAISS